MPQDAAALDLTAAVERLTDTDRLLVSGRTWADGIVQRDAAREGNTNWAVFALTTTGNEQLSA